MDELLPDAGRAENAGDHPPYSSVARHFSNGGYAVCCCLPPVWLPELHHDELEVNVHFENTLAEKTWHSAAGRSVRRTLHHGQISTTGIGQPHSVTWHQEAETVLLFLKPDAFVLATHETPRRSSETVELYSGEDKLIYQLAERLHRDLADGSPFGLLYPDALLTTLTVELLQRYAVHPQPQLGASGQLPAKILRHVRDYIHTHLDQELSLDKIAEASGYSPYHFCRLFRQTVGVSPHQYVLQCRIAEARRLLAQPFASIGEVAYRVGFASQSHFNRHFRRIVGVTPSQYRRNAQ